MYKALKKVAEEVFEGLREGGDYLKLTREKFREHNLPITPENRGFFIHEVASLIETLPRY